MKFVKEKPSITVSWALAAAILSWKVNHSILWALLHGFFGGLYVLYYALFVL